ncbi:MAG: cation:proton antiporter [Gemmatimonadetes bacterium]|nr:cation:proton antiporter [Gemmatimonadota bacterium]MDA1104130.1 cation:proton antiporter [Gemmatimonadota bacterium]
MHDVAFDILILLGGIWLVAVTLRPLGLPTIMGELIVGVLLGPAVFGVIEPSEALTLLSEIGIFFLMFHAGVETQPVEFFDALKRSIGVALVGAIVPFCVAFGVATAFGLDLIAATFVGLTMTATAVVITLKSLKDLGLADTRLARVIVASCVIDDMLTLIFFGLIVGVLGGGSFEPVMVGIALAKVVAFFGVAGLLGGFIYPRLTLPFRTEGGKGFTFILFVAFAAGLFAEAIGLHMILGAYLAGLFFEEKVAHPNLVRVVADRSYGIAYSFLGPIFFMSLGFSVTFDITASALAFMVLLTLGVIVGQIVSAGGMALRMGLPAREALTVGVGMCGRAELAFILAALAFAQGAIDASVFSVLIFTAFVLNLFTPMALKGCAVMLEGRAPKHEGGAVGVLLRDKFADAPLMERFVRRVAPALPVVDDAVVVYGAGPEVEVLLGELRDHGIPSLVIEKEEAAARRLHDRGQRVLHAEPTEHEIDLRPLARARALVLNGDDDDNALFALSAREAGLEGPIIAMIRDPRRRSALLLAGASATFAPTHVLAAVLSSRASALIGPRLSGVRPLVRLLEVAELRVHDASPLAGATLASVGVRSRTGANIVGQWRDAALHLPPAADETIPSGTILIAAGTPESIEKLSEMARPITQEGTIVVVGFGDVGEKLAEILASVDENFIVVDPVARPGVHVVGDVMDPDVLERLPLAEARVVVLALESDSAAALAATVLRDRAPHLPIIAAARLAENVSRIQRAGVDFALSVSQVAGQLLVHHVLGETVSLQPRIKLVRVAAGPLEGRNPMAERIRERTGCTVVAVEVGGEVMMDFGGDFRLTAEHTLYICGTADAVVRYEKEFPTPRL